MNLPIIQTDNKEISLIEIDGTGLPTAPQIMDCYCGTLCHSGESTGMSNLRRFTLGSHSIAVALPGQIVQYESSSADFRATVISMSPSFVSSLGFPYDFNVNKMIEDNPINRFMQQEYEAALNLISMIAGVINNNLEYKLEIIRHLVCAHVYGLSHVMHKGNKIKHAYTADDVLVDRFLNALKANYRTMRSAQEYADLLCVTPGYLVAVLRRVTGKTTLEWISDYVMLEAKALLRSTNMNVQQIAHQLNFPNQSAFGKYFKKIEGISPVNYRNQ